MTKAHQVHKFFKQRTPNKKFIYRCGIAGCSTSYHEAIIVGQPSICWRCGEKFIIYRLNLRNKYFHCVDCTKKKVKSENLDAVDNLINEIIEGEFGSKKEN